MTPEPPVKELTKKETLKPNTQIDTKQESIKAKFYQKESLSSKSDDSDVSDLSDDSEAEADPPTKRPLKQ